MRRGGRARLKASDSKSDRGPEGPSGVQILSPPPIFCATGGSSVRGGVTERPKVRHWKCRARVIPVPRVQIPPPPPLICAVGAASQGLRGSTVGRSLRLLKSCDVAVLDGEVAVPCSPQSAPAGPKHHP